MTYDPAELVQALRGLRAVLGEVSFGLRTASSDEGQRVRDELVGQLDDYLIPRVEQLDAPMLVVIGGSTGAGKSTLVNSLLGEVVSASGVLRPTTRSPVLLVNPTDLPWFADDRILPGLSRSTGAAGTDTRSLRLVPHQAVAPGMALLDAPDIDSVVASNRELAGQLLGAADLWLFVTTAARYADAVPWGFLRTARQRSTALAVVLDRVDPEARSEVEADLRRMLEREGLPDAPVLVVEEAGLEGDLLPERVIEPVRSWLAALAADSRTRTEMVRSTLEGALASLEPRVLTLSSSLRAEASAADELRAAVDTAYNEGLSNISDALAKGALLRGEVLARWQEFVGTGEITRAVEAGVGWVRDRVVGLFRGNSVRPLGADVTAALERSLEAVVRDEAERAADRTASAWSSRPDGAALLRDAPEDLSRASRDLPRAADDAVRQWQGEVLEMVATEGGERRTIARVGSLGINAVGATAMVAIFAHTGGLTGAELATAGGTAALSQKLLEAAFGDQAIRSLAARAGESLLDRLEGVLAEEAARFHRVMDIAVPEQRAAEQVESAAAAVAAAR